MFLFKRVPFKRPLAEECYEHRWLTQSDFMNRKRERAVFLGNRLKVTAAFWYLYNLNNLWQLSQYLPHDLEPKTISLSQVLCYINKK